MGVERPFGGDRKTRFFVLSGSVRWCLVFAWVALCLPTVALAQSELEELEQTLDEAEASLEHTPWDAVRLGAVAEEDATRIGHARARARAQLIVGCGLVQVGRPDEATERLEAALDGGQLTDEERTRATAALARARVTEAPPSSFEFPVGFIVAIVFGALAAGALAAGFSLSVDGNCSSDDPAEVRTNLCEASEVFFWTALSALLPGGVAIGFGIDGARRSSSQTLGLSLGARF